MTRKDQVETAIYEAFDEFEPVDPALPERNLLRAILLSALSDLRKTGEPSRRATDYFLSEDESYIFSFQSVCNFLNIDPKQVLIVAGLRPGLKNALVRKGSFAAPAPLGAASVESAAIEPTPTEMSTPRTSRQSPR